MASKALYYCIMQNVTANETMRIDFAASRSCIKWKRASFFQEKCLSVSQNGNIRACYWIKSSPCKKMSVSRKWNASIYNNHAASFQISSCEQIKDILFAVNERRTWLWDDHLEIKQRISAEERKAEGKKGGRKVENDGIITGRGLCD